jgi:hypothetical protein
MRIGLFSNWLMRMNFIKFFSKWRRLFYTIVPTILIAYLGLKTPINKDSMMKLNADEYRFDILEGRTIQQSAFGRAFLISSMSRSSCFIVKWIEARPGSRLSAIVHFISFGLENKTVANDRELTSDSTKGNPFQIALRAFKGAYFEVYFDDDCKVAKIEGVDSFKTSFSKLYYSADSSANPRDEDVLFTYAFFVEYFQLILPIPVRENGKLFTQELERPAIPGEPLRTRLAISAANLNNKEWDYNSSYSVDQILGQNFDNQVPLKGSGVGTIKLDPCTGRVRSSIYNIDATGSLFLGNQEVELKIKCHSETRVEKITNTASAK